jgi:murein DD-endopeptidase MepM/ murein hydrolase activator NlpD
MTTAHRDLSAPELWERSLERSRYRRSLLPGARRRQNRRKGIAAAMSAATVAGPASPMAFASLSSKPQADLGAETASKRAIEVREGGLPLQLGSQGPLVAQVQKAPAIPADGIFGVQTYVAVRAYQARAGLQVDGVVGPATWGAMFPPASAARGGDAPPEVKQRLERELRAAGARLDERAAEPVDKLFGPNERAGSAAERSSGSATSDPAPEGSTGSGEPSAGDDGQTPAEEPKAPAEEPKAPAQEPKAPAGGEGQSSQPVNTSCGSSTIRPPLKGTVTSPFGPRWGRMHEGLDIAAPTGTAIHAAACGRVTIAGVQDGYGNIVCITHSSRFATCYAHMSRFAVSQGAQVRAGQVIGYVGCTGNCTGPHVHFETRVNGQAQDPSPYLNGSRAASASAASRATARSGAAGGRTAAVMTTGGGATAPGTGTAGQARWSGSTSAVGASESVAGSGGAEVAAAPVAPVQPAAAPVTPAAPVEPAPVEPAPVAVTPAAPVEPAPVPVTPTAPVQPAPVPVTPAAPVEPAPVAVTPAAPVEPAPVPVEPAPAPVEPAPVPAEPVAAPAEPVAAPTEPAPAPAEAVAPPVEPAAAPAEPVAAPAEPVAAPAEAAPAAEVPPSQ